MRWGAIPQLTATLQFLGPDLRLDFVSRETMLSRRGLKDRTTQLRTALLEGQLIEASGLLGKQRGRVSGSGAGPRSSAILVYGRTVASYTRRW